MGNHAKTAAGVAIVLALAMIGGGQRAEAGPGSTIFTGTLDGTLNGTPFSDASFTATASLLSHTSPTGGYVVYSSTVVFDISGVGTSVPITGAYTVALGPPLAIGYGTYGVELDMPGNVTLTEFFNARNFVTLAPGDSETLYSDATYFDQSGSLALSLVGGGTVDDIDFDSLGAMLPLVAPEPSSLAVLGTAMMAGVGLRRGRRG